MTDNSKISRIFSVLQKAKGKGIKEIDLLDDFESKGNTRVIKYRLCKFLGDSEGVVVKDGVWFLAEDYWNMTKVEFRDLMFRFMLMEISHKNSLVIIAIVGIMSVLVAVAFSVGYNMGVPDTLQRCVEQFDSDLIYETEWPEELQLSENVLRK